MKALFLCWVLVSIAPVAWGHSIVADRISGGIGISARYADGTPAASAEVKVFAPGENQPFQEGLTDREGRFLFFPPTTGDWRIVVDDGIGHALDETLPVHDLEADSQSAPDPAPPQNRLWPMLTGIGIIWAIFGMWGWWRASRR